MSVRRIRISGELLNSFLRDNELWKSSLPEDVDVLGIVLEDYRPRTFVLIVESHEFAAIAEGQLVPFVEAVFERKASRAL
jgi:hypothetical protein